MDVDQTLAMYRRQERSLEDVKWILSGRGSTVSGELFERYKKVFAPMSTKKASDVERMLHEHREGFSPDPETARNQVKKILDRYSEGYST